MRNINKLTYDIIGCAYKVHKELGSGLLESTYEICMAYELKIKGYDIITQLALPVVYQGMKLEAGYRIDILVENAVIIELKSVEGIAPIHKAQLLTYLKLSGKKLGLLINFNVTNLQKGIYRYIN